MYNNYLAHYGVKGMKWGVRHDTPRVGVKRKTSSKKSKLTPKQKKILMYGAIGVGAVLAAYGGYKIYGVSSKRHNKALAERILKFSGDHLASSLNEAQDRTRRNFPDSIQKTAWKEVDAARNSHEAAKQIAENISTQKRRVKNDKAWGAFKKAAHDVDDFTLWSKIIDESKKK